MAGANNAQFKAHGHSAKLITKARAKYGKMDLEKMHTFSRRQGKGKTGSRTLAQRAAAAVAARPAGKPKLTAASFTWKQQPGGGYAASDGRAKLEKSGKKWTLVLRDGSRHSLPRKASFDHAERAMARLGAR